MEKVQKCEVQEQSYVLSPESFKVIVPVYTSRGPGSIPGVTTFSEE
jgi:hypothetical protein